MASYRLIFKNRIVVVVPDVVSETEVDEEVYDLTNYRDDMDQTLVAKAQLSVGAAAYSPTPDTTPTAPSPEPVSSLTVASSLSPAILKTGDETFYSISDTAAHIPPRNEMKKRTKLKLWSAAAGGGTLLYSAWSDLLQSWGVATSEEYV